MLGNVRGQNRDVPRKKSPRARAVATPLRFGIPSRETQLADNKMVSVPADRGGWTWAYVESEVLPVLRPASAKAFWRKLVRLYSRCRQQNLYIFERTATHSSNDPSTMRSS